MAAHLIVDATTREVSNLGMKRILAALLLLTLAAPVWGQDFDKDYQAYERGDYATAVKWFRKAAELVSGRISAAMKGKSGEVVGLKGRAR